MRSPDLTPFEADLQKSERRVALYPHHPQAYVRRGMAHFKCDRVVASVEDFNTAERLHPDITPYLWQRGLSYYCLGEFANGAQQFAADLAVNASDLEESLWLWLCQRHSDLDCSTTLSKCDPQADLRPVLQRIYQFYGGDLSAEALMAAADNRHDRFYSLLYWGLYADATGDETTARTALVEAATQWAIADYMWHVAVVLGRRRGWLEGD